MARKKNKEYYAVLEGHRLAQPTIYSSWAKAHVRTTGYSPKRRVSFKSFYDLRAAKDFVLANCGGHYKVDIKSEKEQTTPENNAQAYYAVANGRNPGIYPYFHSDGGAEPQVNQEPHSCHKSFRSEEQARQFIEDWCKCFLNVLVETTAEQLQAGWRPPLGRLNPTIVKLLPPASTSGDDIIQLVDELAQVSV